MHIYYLIDASTNEGYEEEEYFDDEENFDHFTNQGKPSCNLPCKLSCKLSCDTLIFDPCFTMHVLQAYFCLEKIIGLDESWLVLMFSRASSSLDSLVWNTIIMIPSYA